MTKSIDQHEGSKYLRKIRSAKKNPSGVYFEIEIDVYSVLEAFNITCPARQHALKKLLCCGNRSKGSELEDLIGAEAAISRAIELQRNRESSTQQKLEPFHPEVI